MRGKGWGLGERRRGRGVGGRAKAELDMWLFCACMFAHLSSAPFLLPCRLCRYELPGKCWSLSHTFFPHLLYCPVTACRCELAGRCWSPAVAPTCAACASPVCSCELLNRRALVPKRGPRLTSLRFPGLFL